MKYLSIIIITSLTATALGSAVPYGVPPDCTHHNNGACVSSPAQCTEGELQCLTTLNNGYDGINICEHGKWEARDTCRCTDKPSPQCIDATLSSRDNTLSRRCEEGVPKCMLREHDRNGGVLFRCKNGFWKTVMRCRPSERCHDGELATCSWLGAA